MYSTIYYKKRKEKRDRPWFLPLVVLTEKVLESERGELKMVV
jgi:hypothetical protein